MSDGTPFCALCNDTGMIAIDAITAGYRAPGPVPEDARGVAETYCGCAIGGEARREDVRP